MTELSSLKLIKSPVGKISIGATQSGVAQIEILPPGSVRIEFSDSAKAHRFALDAADQLSEFFEGSRKGFSVPLDIAGTAFQLAVWTQIAKLDFGEQKTYAELALAVGNPKASSRWCRGRQPSATTGRLSQDFRFGKTHYRLLRWRGSCYQALAIGLRAD
jgi:O6-methylguanine-DNA--protein-cysteine methyltransferase